MASKSRVTGVVLSGGRSSRMDGKDKGLLELAGRPLIVHVLRQVEKIADPVLISANRNLDAYRSLGYPVISDEDGDFNGPLAGVLAAMSQARSPLLVTAPCDTPMVSVEHFSRLIAAFDRHQPDACIAHDGHRLQPAFMLIRTDLEQSLREYLTSGERRIRVWLRSHRLLEVDFSDSRQLFANVNTPEELLEVEKVIARLKPGTEVDS